MEGTQSVAELARDLEATKVALNFVWVLIAAFMVMLMQAGFAMVETGLVRAKNVGHTMAMNFLVYCSKSSAARTRNCNPTGWNWKFWKPPPSAT